MTTAARRAGVAPSTAPSTSADEVVRHAPDGIAVIDAEARFVDANPAAVRPVRAGPASGGGHPVAVPARRRTPPGAPGPVS